MRRGLVGWSVGLSASFVVDGSLEDLESIQFGLSKFLVRHRPLSIIPLLFPFSLSLVVVWGFTLLK